ncbi:MAG: DUF1015 domain-containing protein [Deltaproteobacteria bacterium]|nr:DUF1015 domain-containing protein [Deltaproteobacteria bacterium]TLN03502.1 MAG: DUF1015 domain-containing protein [bacterium]
MALIKPFRALRPLEKIVQQVAAPPYDVMSVAEARSMAEGNPFSFLHISRPEIDLSPDVDPHDEAVYRKGQENLAAFIHKGTLLQDHEDGYYIYQQKMGPVIQTGLVACASVDDYQSGLIKKHELTRADKEEDRVLHIDYLDANDEPVFYVYRNSSVINDLIACLTKTEPLYDFTTADSVEHTVWAVSDVEVIRQISAEFAHIETLYVADGHHRSAAASRVRELRKERNVNHIGSEEYNFFLTVIFPDNEMNVMAYNRAVKDLNGLSIVEFVTLAGEKFDITPVETAVKPAKRHDFGMYLKGKWYSLTPKPGIVDETDAVGRLDVSILQDQLLSPILGVRNPRTDQRIHFVGGSRGTEELVKLVDSGEFQVSFSLYPTSIDELMSLADAGKIMPPKSTWFEPKLLSGLFLHQLS